jgi:hypothetical protein
MGTFTCDMCHKPIMGSIYAIESKTMCGHCYSELSCRYCDPPLLEDNCPGHNVSRTTENRFMADKEFVSGSRFELE